MSDAVTRIIAAVVAREGGYVNHPADKGGPTKYGITRKTLSDWMGVEATAEMVRALTVEDAARIYRERYVEGPGFDVIADPDLLELVFDCAVLHGQPRAARWLQRALKVEADGVIGPATRAALAAADARKLRVALAAVRIRAIGRTVTDDPSQAAFAAGWTDRAAAFVEKLA